MGHRHLLLATVACLASQATASTITGTVFDSTGAKALNGAEIRIPALNRSTVADTGGTFRFADVPAGTWSVEARSAGTTTSVQSVTVVEDGTARLSFALAPAGEDATIIVLGQQASLLSSLQRQRSSDIVASILTRDSIGQFPDQNVAEAVRRVPGTNVLNDQGEGRFIAIRGLAPDLNAASVNGVRLPAPESDIRAVALDVVPVDLIESITVEKSLTPDRDADAIGGTIDIRTPSAFDRGKPYLTVIGEAGYATLRDAVSPRTAIDFGKTFGNFGVAGGFSWHKRKFSTDNVEADGWEEADDGTVYAEDIEYRDYDVDRTRIGATLNLDWRPTEDGAAYVRGLYSRFADQESRRRLIFGFDEPSSGTATTAAFDSGDAEIGVERDLKDRFEAQEILSLGFGGRYTPGLWTLSADVSYSEASEQEDGSVDPVTFARDFEEDDALSVVMDYSDRRIPGYSILSGAETFLDAGEYEFDELSRTTRSDSRDRDWAFRGDAAREFGLSAGTLTVQGGMKARFRTKRYDGTFDIFDGFDGDLTLADVEGTQSYSLADIDPMVSLLSWRDFLDGTGYSPFERDDFSSDFDSAIEDYEAEENVLAGYVLGRYETDTVRIIGGLRVERTQTDTTGNIVSVTETEDDEFLDITPVSFSKRYTDWLPSLNVRYEAMPDLITRFGVYRSLVRPNFAQFAPRFEIAENVDGDREGAFGNPDLDPYRAWNIDATAEWYFSKEAVVQAGVFYKRINDFIFDAAFEDGEFNGISFTEAVIPLNGESARVIGFEFGYSHALLGLPAPFDGLIVSLNYTYTDAEGDIGDRVIPLPTTSRHTANMVFGYDRGPISFRLAGTYRSSYLDEVGDDAETDRIVDGLFQLDLTAKYQVNSRMQVFAEFVNLNNAKYFAFQRGPESDRLLQFEEYRWTGKFGARLTF